MGTYLIPSARSIQEATEFIGGTTMTRTWTPMAGGGLAFADTSLSDAECAALYAAFVPTGVNDLSYIASIPVRWRAHLIHLRDYRDGIRDGTLTPTQAQRDHVIADIIDGLARFDPRQDTD